MQRRLEAEQVRQVGSQDLHIESGPMKKPGPQAEQVWLVEERALDMLTGGLQEVQLVAVPQQVWQLELHG